MPVYIDEAWIELIRASLPEPAHEKFARMTGELGLPENDCLIITGSMNLSRIFEETLRYTDKPRDVINWINGELLSIAKAAGVSDDDINIDCKKFAEIIEFVEDKTINRAMGKKILQKVFDDNIDPASYIEENKLGMVSDEGLLEKVIAETLSANEKSVNEFRNGSQKVFGYLVGQVMRNTGGKADPKAVNELLEKALTGR